METPKLYQYAVLWHPTDKQREDDDIKSKIVVELDTVLATSPEAAMLAAARKIPDSYVEQLDQIEVALRPF